MVSRAYARAHRTRARMRRAPLAPRRPTARGPNARTRVQAPRCGPPAATTPPLPASPPSRASPLPLGLPREAGPTPQSPLSQLPGHPLSDPSMSTALPLRRRHVPHPAVMTQRVACLHAVLRHRPRSERRLRSQHPRTLLASAPLLASDMGRARPHARTCYKQSPPIPGGARGAVTGAAPPPPFFENTVETCLCRVVSNR